MSFFDDLKQAAEDNLKKAGADVSSYLASTVSAPFIGIAQNLGGNVTTQQIEAGKANTPQPVAAPASQQLLSSVMTMSPVLLFAAVGLGAFLIFRRR